MTLTPEDRATLDAAERHASQFTKDGAIYMVRASKSYKAGWSAGTAHGRALQRAEVIATRAERDELRAGLDGVANFPITNPGNMDAQNMRLMARALLTNTKDGSNEPF